MNIRGTVGHMPRLYQGEVTGIAEVPQEACNVSCQIEISSLKDSE